MQSMAKSLVEEIWDSIAAEPYNGLRRVLIRRFPSPYRLNGDVISVVAVMHGRRDPKDWQPRG